MRVQIKLEPFSRELRVLLPEAADPYERAETLAAYARQVIQDTDEGNAAILGYKLPYDVYVDGRFNAPLNSVKPDGMIEAEWTFFEGMFQWIDTQLFAHSPVGKGNDPRPGHPGTYMRSHEFTADGQLVDRSKPVPMADEFVFVNTVPYARKIEGSGGRPPLSSQAPSGVYETVAKMAADRWGNMASIRFGFRSPLFGNIMAWASTTKRQPKGRRRLAGASRTDWLTRQPAIIIKPRH